MQPPCRSVLKHFNDFLLRRIHRCFRTRDYSRGRGATVRELKRPSADISNLALQDVLLLYWLVTTCQLQKERKPKREKSSRHHKHDHEWAKDFYWNAIMVTAFQRQWRKIKITVRHCFWRCPHAFTLAPPKSNLQLQETASGLQPRGTIE